MSGCSSSLCSNRSLFLSLRGLEACVGDGHMLGSLALLYLFLYSNCCFKPLWDWAWRGARRGEWGSGGLLLA